MFGEIAPRLKALVANAAFRILGGGANQVLYQDANQNLASSPNLTWTGAALTQALTSGTVGYHATNVTGNTANLAEWTDTDGTTVRTYVGNQGLFTRGLSVGTAGAPGYDVSTFGVVAAILSSGGLGIRMAADAYIGFNATTNNPNGTAADVSLVRASAGVLKVVSGVVPTTGYGALIVGVSDAGTTTTPTGLTVSHKSSGTPAAGFGSSVLLAGQSSTTAEQPMARLVASWATATDASRKARAALLACDSTGTDREGFRVESDGTQTLTSVNGVAAVARAAAIATPTDLATSITAITAIRDAIKAFGITS